MCRSTSHGGRRCAGGCSGTRAGNAARKAVTRARNRLHRIAETGTPEDVAAAQQRLAAARKRYEQVRDAHGEQATPPTAPAPQSVPSADVPSPAPSAGAEQSQETTTVGGFTLHNTNIATGNARVGSQNNVHFSARDGMAEHVDYTATVAQAMQRLRKATSTSSQGPRRTPAKSTPRTNVAAENERRDGTPTTGHTGPAPSRRVQDTAGQPDSGTPTPTRRGGHDVTTTRNVASGNDRVDRQVGLDLSAGAARVEKPAAQRGDGTPAAERRGDREVPAGPGRGENTAGEQRDGTPPAPSDPQVGGSHGDIGRVSDNPAGPITVDNRKAPGARRPTPGQDGEAINLVHGRNFGVQTGVVVGGITINNSGAGQHRDGTPDPVEGRQPSRSIHVGPDGKVTITNPDGSTAVQAVSVLGTVWVNGRRVQ